MKDKKCSVLWEKSMQSGLDFQEKTLGPADPNVFIFSHQQKYFNQ